MTKEETDTKTSACPSCPTGRLEEDTTTLTFTEDSGLTGTFGIESRSLETPLIVITGVPAEVCDVCGEAVIDSETTEQVSQAVSDVRYLWNRFPDKLPTDSLVIGGQPGEEGGIVRLDFEKTPLSTSRKSVRWEN